MKRKIVALAVVIAMLAIAIIGGTLAYFTDTDSETNVLTMGNVKIEIHEDNDDPNSDADVPVVDDEYRDWLEAQPFHPGVTLEKNVTIENVGENDAYVRVFTAWPLMAEKMLALEFDNGTVWTPVELDDTGALTVPYDSNNAPKVMKDDNGVTYYVTKIDGEYYRVACYTYHDNGTGTLAPDATTPDNLTSIKLREEVQCKVNPDGSTTYFVLPDENASYEEKLNNYYYTSKDGQIPVLVHAQAVQTTTFADPYEAFNAAFGPYNQNWWSGTYTADGDGVFVTSPIVAKDTAIYLDGQDGFHVYGTSVTGEQLAYIDDASGLYFTNANIETESGIYVSKNGTNTMIILDNSDFIIKDGDLLIDVDDTAGAVTVMIVGKVTVNGTEITRANYTKFFDSQFDGGNCCVYW